MWGEAPKGSKEAEEVKRDNLPVQPWSGGNAKMSVLTPILTPPKVKKYMIEGERFIRWDDVSTMTILALIWTWEQNQGHLESFGHMQWSMVVG